MGNSDNFHLGHQFVKAMQRDPDAICQIDAATGAKEMNASVLSRSVRLARSMRQFGFQTGDILALGGKNHLNLHIPYYAALMNGYPIMGVDPLFKEDEIKAMFKLTRPKIAFCQQSSQSMYTNAAKELGLDVTIITFEDGKNSMRKFVEKNDYKEPENEFKVAEFNPEKLYAYLVSTSGTTGVLKVAAFTHRTVQKKLSSYLELAKITNVRTIGLNLSPVQWISGIISAINMPLMKQTKLQTSGPDNLDHIIDIINKYKPYSMLMSPTLMSVLVSRKNEVDLSCFKMITATGARIRPDAMEELRKCMDKNAILFEAYGMTETLGPVLTPSAGIRGSCGRTMSSYAIKLIDPDTRMEVIEPYKTGEMWVKGLCFSEYLNNLEETANVFSEDGFFKTGDLLYRDENNNYFFVDRIKMLIKYKNAHVIPSELEEVLIKHPGVLDVCVTSVEDVVDGQHPVACVIKRTNYKVTAQELKDLVSSKLSKTKQLYGGVVFLDKFPLTSSGKVARAKIRDLVKNIHRE